MKVTDAEFRPVRKDGSLGPKHGPKYYPHPEWPYWSTPRKIAFMALYVPILIGIKVALFWLIGVIGLRH